MRSRMLSAKIHMLCVQEWAALFRVRVNLKRNVAYRLSKICQHIHVRYLRQQKLIHKFDLRCHIRLSSPNSRQKYLSQSHLRRHLNIHCEHWPQYRDERYLESHYNLRDSGNPQGLDRQLATLCPSRHRLLRCARPTPDEAKKAF